MRRVSPKVSLKPFLRSACLYLISEALGINSGSNPARGLVVNDNNDNN